MSKRGADKQLTHDNWDAEDSGGEEAGQFQTASEDVLKGRVIKKARRRVNRADDSVRSARRTRASRSYASCFLEVDSFFFVIFVFRTSYHGVIYLISFLVS